tara:strand:- start:407 stop:745 length:339 start_codon:yes stop_codon:yes gene_type:complete
MKRAEAADFVRNIFNRFQQGPDDYNPFSEFQGEDSGAFEYSTLGPGRNEGIKNYSFGQTTHAISFVDFVSPDIFLVHQSKMIGFYVKTNSSDRLKPVDRQVKDLILRDANFR